MVQRTVPLVFLAVAAAAALAACSGRDPGGGGPAVDAGAADAGAPDAAPQPGPVARIVVEPRGALLTPALPAQQLVARAFDADGVPVDADIVWSSSDAAVVSVDATGGLRAEVPLGSALVTAQVGAVRATVFAIAAEPVAGAVLVRDDEIVGVPEAVDASAPFRAGYRYRVELAGAVPAVGATLMSVGEKPVGGRVVAVDGRRVTVEQVDIHGLFAHLAIDESLTLEDAAPAPLARRPRFAVGPFECEAEGSLGGFELARNERTPQGLDTLRIDLEWDDALDRLVRLEVRGNPGVSFELQPMLVAALEGSVSCRAILKEYPLPIPGPLRLLLGAAVVVGAGVELGGRIPVAGVGINLAGEVRAQLSMGVDCRDQCTALRGISATASLTPTLIAPQVSLRVEPEAQAFVFAELEGGAAFSSQLRTEAIAGQAGVKLAASFASEETQARDPAYQSEYQLTLETQVGPGAAIVDFFDLLDLGLSFLRFEHSAPLGRSPTGTLSGAPASFTAGDDVEFVLDLAPADVALPLTGYNVDRVRVYRREVQPDGSVSLILASEAIASDGQTRFTLPWVATVDGEVGGNFVAFVTTRLVGDPRLEVATTQSRELSGGLVAAGGTLQATDGYTTVLPPSQGGNTGSVELPVGVLYFSTAAPDGLLVCSAEQERGNSVYVQAWFSQVGGLAPGTYPFAPGFDATPGTFSAVLVGLGGCVTLPDGTTGCSCAQQSVSFASGSLVVTEVSGAVVGTMTLQTSGGATLSGSFTIPTCDKSFAEHLEADSRDCLPPAP